MGLRKVRILCKCLFLRTTLVSSILFFFLRSHTECFSCCEGSKCNDLESALSNLPSNIFDDEKSKKSKKEDDSDSDEDDSNSEEDETEGENDAPEIEDASESIGTDSDDEEDDEDEPNARTELKETEPDQDEIEEEESFLKDLEKLIAEDEEKLEKGEDINIKTPVMFFNDTELNDSDDEVEDVAVSSEPVDDAVLATSMEPEVLIETVGETLNETEYGSTTEYDDVIPNDFNDTVELNSTSPEETPQEGDSQENVELIDETGSSDDDSEEFSGEHDALTGSAKTIKFELSLVLVNIIFLAIKSLRSY